MATLRNDFRFAVRRFLGAPAFSVTVVLILAIGIGVNIAVFSLFDRVVLKKLPVSKPEQLVLLSERSILERGSLNAWGDPRFYFSYLAYRSMQDGNHTFEGLAAMAVIPVTLANRETAEKVFAESVTGNYFELLGIHAIAGRLISPADDVVHNGNRVAVLSGSYWRARFGADPSLINHSVLVNGQPFEIVGVVDYEGFSNEYVPALFIPLASESVLTPGSQDKPSSPLYRWIVVFGRLKPGVAQSQAQAELGGIWWNWRKDALAKLFTDEESDRRWLQTQLVLEDGSQGLPFLKSVLGGPVKGLLCLVFLVLIVGCSNVATLFLVRAARKRNELNLLAAIGASPIEIFRHVLAEGFLVGTAGSFTGIALGIAILHMSRKWVPVPGGPRESLILPLDVWVWVAAVVLGIATCVIVSIAPAILCLRLNPADSLRSGSPRLTAAGSRTRNVLVVSEIALSLVLLLSASLFAWTLYDLRSIHPGYSTDRLITFAVDAPSLGKDSAQTRNEYEAIKANLTRLGGVGSVSYTSMTLLSGDQSGGTITVPGFEDKYSNRTTDEMWVTPEFMHTVRIPLIAGRDFSVQDSETSEKVAIADTAFIDRYFGGNIQGALGRRLGLGSGDDVKLDVQIVGVVPVIRAVTLRSAPGLPFLYFPYDQIWSERPSYPASFYLRTNVDPTNVVGMVRASIRAVDRDLPILGLQTMQQEVDDAIFEQRLMALLAVALAGLALLLAAIGEYGVLMFTIVQRTQEIGIRIALGASRANVILLILRQLLTLTAIGIAVGVPLSWIGLRFLRGSLQDLTGSAQLAFAASSLILLAVSGLAGLLPVLRAANVDPIEALRME
jgi:putative ABC transport system permease protein